MTEPELECYTLTMVNEISARRIKEDRSKRDAMMLRALMDELGKYHKDSDAFLALSRFWVALGGSINVCG